MPSKPSSHSSEPDNSELNDAELFLLLQTGQTKALAILYERHAALVYGIALQILSNINEAEDLTQDIFLMLTKKCGYNSKRGTLRTYLAILTRSRAIDRLRTQSRKQTRLRLNQQSMNESARVVPNNFMEEISQTERSQEVKLALTRLSNEERKVLKMAYYEGFSQSEIANRLDIAIGTVKSRSRRALLKLRQFLVDLGGEL